MISHSIHTRGDERIVHIKNIHAVVVKTTSMNVLISDLCFYIVFAHVCV